MEASVEKFSSSSLRPTLEKVLRHLVEEKQPSGLTSDFCTRLLQDDETEKELKSDNGPAEANGGLQYIAGYPAGPLYVRLADCTSYWAVSGNCPVFELPVMYMLNEEGIVQERKERLDSVGVKLKDLYKEWESWSSDEQFHYILDMLKLLNVRGILDLLGLRHTAGSCHTLPPPRHVLLTSFNRPHHPAAKLTEGGRALSKHCHRDDSLQWWGTCTGSEAAKNAHALQVALRILNSATWINIHMLPHDVQVLEVRHPEGYGMRWSSEGSEFRGFLEPQMEEGHAVGWRH